MECFWNWHILWESSNPRPHPSAGLQHLSGYAVLGLEVRALLPPTTGTKQTRHVQLNDQAVHAQLVPCPEWTGHAQPSHWALLHFHGDTVGCLQWPLPGSPWFPRWQHLAELAMRGYRGHYESWKFGKPLSGKGKRIFLITWARRQLLLPYLASLKEESELSGSDCTF